MRKTHTNCTQFKFKHSQHKKNVFNKNWREKPKTFCTFSRNETGTSQDSGDHACALSRTNYNFVKQLNLKLDIVVMKTLNFEQR